MEERTDQEMGGRHQDVDLDVEEDEVGEELDGGDLTQIRLKIPSMMT